MLSNDNLHAMCSLQGFIDILTMWFRLEKLAKLQEATARKLAG